MNQKLIEIKRTNPKLLQKQLKSLAKS